MLVSCGRSGLTFLFTLFSFVSITYASLCHTFSLQIHPCMNSSMLAGCLSAVKESLPQKEMKLIATPTPLSLLITLLLVPWMAHDLMLQGRPLSTPCCSPNFKTAAFCQPENKHTTRTGAPRHGARLLTQSAGLLDKTLDSGGTVQPAALSQLLLKEDQ